MSSLLSSIYSVLSSYNAAERQRLESSVANLSSRDRESLAQDVALELDHEQVESSLADLETTLAESKTSLEKFEKKERFLGLRLGRYRELMDRREDHMNNLMERMQQTNSNGELLSDNDEDDVENTNLDHLREQIETLEAKHAADQISLRSVEDCHKDIIVQIEELRRNIRDLEEKQESIGKQRDECRDFLVAAAEYT